MPSYDTIIIGAGINGLACAAHLTGSVLLLESGAVAGGAMGAQEFVTGRHSLAHTTQGLDARVMRKFGLTSADFDTLTTTALSKTGDHLSLLGGVATGPDATAFADLHAQLTRFAQVLAPFRSLQPPRLARHGNEWLKLARHGLGIRAMGRDDFRALMRMILINVYDVTMDELKDPLLQGLMAFDATLGAWLGPRSPNSLILYLNRLAMGSDPLLPKGGMGHLCEKLVQGLPPHVSLRLQATVGEILIKQDHVTGVRLTSGEEIFAARVVSAISPKTTFETLIPAAHLDTGFLRSSRNIRARGATAKLHLSLHELPDFQGADPRHRLVIAPNAEDVERAFNPVKYGELPENPVMEIILPSAHHTHLAPQLSALVQFVPDTTQDLKAQMLENCLRAMSPYAPDLGKLILKAELLMPADIRARYGLSNWHHAELSVEQMLFNRPFQAVAQYQTPISGLWLASAGSHPGGGINGAAGCNAAKAMMAAP